MAHAVRLAGFLAAVTICLMIAGSTTQAFADTSADSDSGQSREAAAGSGAERANSGGSPAISSPSTSYSKVYESEDPAAGRESRESEHKSESSAALNEDPAALPEDAGQERKFEETSSEEEPEPLADTDLADTPVTDTDDSADAAAPGPGNIETSDDAAVAPEPDEEPTQSAPQPGSATTASSAQERDTAPSAARAVAPAAAQPDFFTWIRRTFFNRTPTVSFDPDTLTVRSDGTITGSVLGADADGDVLTYTAGRPTNGGTVVIDTSGMFVYSPGDGFAYDGTDLFAVTVSDDGPGNGWHVHGLLGFLIPGWGSTATTNVGIRAGVPGGDDTTTAGGRYGWGTPKETTFTGFEALSDAWYIYDSPGHNGWGRRTPEAISFVDGVMVITGDAAGNTGGLSWDAGQKYGAWEVRLKVPAGAADYHAVALLWPDAENWPVGGEIDFVEILGNAERQRVNHFLHYSAQNLTEGGATEVDATQWHNYAVSWTPDAITIYIDGMSVYQSTNRWVFPPGPMHLALQLDASEKRPPNLSGGAQLMVAWARQYTLSQIS